MDNKGIWDIIGKLTSGLSQGENKEKNEAEKGKSSENQKGFKDFLKNQDENSPSKGKNPSPDLSKKDENSFLKTYNPFSSVSSGKSQIVAKRAVKTAKGTIDLKKSKNLAAAHEKSTGSNMVELIKRHNSFMEKINGKNC